MSAARSDPTTSRWASSRLALVAAAAAVAGVATVMATSGGGAERAGAVPDSTVPDDSVPGDTGPGAAEADGTIVVNGRGTVDVTPDIARLTVGVQATAATGEEVMTTVGDKSQALIDTLTALGIAAEDLQTSGLGLWPTYGEDGTTVRGYQASVNVDVTARDVTRVGEYLDAARGFVGEELTIGGISFSFDDPEAALESARTAAIDNARVRAEQYAAAADVEVGSIVKIIETPAASAVPLFQDELASADSAAAGRVAIEPGSQELGVDVTVVFDMG